MDSSECGKKKLQFVFEESQQKNFVLALDLASMTMVSTVQLEALAHLCIVPFRMVENPYSCVQKRCVVVNMRFEGVDRLLTRLSGVAMIPYYIA